MKILVVEDDEVIAQQIRARLEQEGFAVETAADGEEGLYFGAEYEFDAAIVDLGLPKMGGVEMIKRLRSQERAVPVLILTARDAWQDKVEGLQAGADDYVVKPFHMEELLARINALVRRAAGHASPVLKFAGVTLDSARQEVFAGDARLELTAYEYKVLEYLMLHRDRVISKGELTEHIYEQDFDRDSNTIEVFVGRLRRKIKDGGGTSPIATHRGRGYRFQADEPLD